MNEKPNLLRAMMRERIAAREGVEVGSHWYLSPWWVEVMAFTPKTRFVRFLREGRPG